MIYLDHAAATPINKEILKAYNSALISYFANPSSAHGLGHASLRTLENLDVRTLKLLKLNSNFEIIHVSGATEANNLAIIGYATRNPHKGSEIWCLPSEHPSTLNAMMHLRDKHSLKLISGELNKNGQIDLERLSEQLNEDTLLVSVSLVNSEVGYLNDIDAIVNLVRQKSHARIHVDLVQGYGHVSLFDLNRVDFITLTLHKLGGPKTHGLLIKRKELLLDSLVYGGGQQKNVRSGTEDLPGAIAMYKALQLAQQGLKENKEKIEEINWALHNNFKKSELIRINSTRDGSPYIFNMSLLKHKGSVVIEALSNQEIYVSSTSACSSRTNKGSKTLELVGESRQISENSIRLSFSYETTIEEISAFTEAFNRVLGRIKQNG